MDLGKRFSRARALFPHTRKVVYLNSASYGPFSTLVKNAIDDNVSLRLRADRDDSHDAFAAADELRSVYARMIGARKREVGIGLNTSFGLNIAAFGLPLKRGDEILMSDFEFPAVPYAWRAAAEARGLKLKFIRSKRKHVAPDDVLKALTKRTRVLCVSWVQFFNGFKNDLAALSELCHGNRVWLVVDGIQGMGVEPINVRKLGVDVFTSGCQKWMLSPQGGGFFYLSDAVRDKLAHSSMSWLGVDWKMNFTDMFRFDLPYFDSARRFELGYYAVLNLLGMKASADLIENLGIRNIRKHNHTLIDRLADYIRGKPLYTITSSMDKAHRSSIFTFTCPGYKKLHRELLKRRIILVEREGSIRVSVHLFNNERDIDRLIAILDRFAKTGSRTAGA